MNIGARFRSLLKGTRSVASVRTLLLCGSMLLAAQQPAQAAATQLADQPLFSYNAVPGNLLLSLSVEFPTAISVASPYAYINTKQYLGIFDPGKCYLYNFNAATYYIAQDPYNYFYPVSAAPASNNCGGTKANPEWSGNWLNWAGMQTIDPFRWALTGGYRSLDADNTNDTNTVINTGILSVGILGKVKLADGLTVLEKAYGPNQGSASSNFPDRSMCAAYITGVTPLGVVNGWNEFGTRIWNAGNQLFFTISNVSSPNCETSSGNVNPGIGAATNTGNVTGNLDGASLGTNSSYTPFDPGFLSANTVQLDQVYSVKVRVQACAGGTLNESNCTTYGNWAKPEGLMQQYSQKIRYGAFGYLNEAGTALDGGVLRGRMNFIGPTKPVVNSTPVDNTPPNYGGSTTGLPGTGEWSGTTGVYYQEPDLADELATNTYFGSCGIRAATTGLGGVALGACAYNSGTLNYLNKFGETSQSYKTDDPVSELYYASMRYFRWFNGNPLTMSPPVMDAVPEYELKSTSGSTNFTWVDGFPVIGACGSPGGPNSCSNSWTRHNYIAQTATTAGTPITSHGYTCGASPIPGDTCLGIDPDDPIEYACQKNFILGIGDIHTHADGDLPGGAPYSGEEPTVQPPAVAADTTMNFTVPAATTTTYTAPGVQTIINIQSGTDMLGALENIETTASTTTSAPSAGDNKGNAHPITCELTPNLDPSATGCSGSTHLKYLVSGGDDSTYFMAGEAYDAHTRDIRPHEFLDATGTTKAAGISTVSTYWLDVLESQDYQWRNQFWLAAKFGGFTVGTAGWNTYGATTVDSTTNSTEGPLTKQSWNANGLTDLGFPGITTAAAAHPLPDHYYNASQASLLVSGLQSAFSSISNSLNAFTTSFALASPIVQGNNNVAYSSQFSSQYWSGTVLGNTITSFDADNNPVFGSGWTTDTTMAAQTPNSRSIVTCCSASATAPGVQFSTVGLSNAATLGQYAQLAAPALSATSDQVLAWLRGDHTDEVISNGTLRNRVGFTLGDIVDSDVVAVGPPSTFYSDATNPGYSSFASACSARSPMAYVGANDGMVHGFNGTVGNSNSGYEIFAYVPKATFNGPTNPQTDGLQSLANPTFVHHFFVDSTPTITDIFIPTTPTTGYFNNSSVPYTTTCAGAVNTGAAKGWMSLLVEGMGKGGKSYFAIDVTDPDQMSNQGIAATKVKWEFTDPTMGFTFGEPVVVKTKKYGWVVILTSGYDNADGNGYFYFVNPATGTLFEPPLKVGVNPAGGNYPGFGLGSISPTNPVGMGPATAFVNDYTDYTADAVYAGDLQGHIWRVDLTSSTVCTSVPCTPYAAPTEFAQLTVTGTATPQPVTVRVLTEIQPSSNARRILIGTGELLSTADISNTDIQSIYSIVDGTSTPGQFFTTATLPSGYSFPIVKTNLATDNLFTGLTATQLEQKPLGFYVDLPPPTASGSSFRINVPMAEDGGELAVTANAPQGDACDPTGTHIDYALDIGTGASDIKSCATCAVSQYFIPASGSGTGTGASFIETPGGAVQPYFGNSGSGQPEAPPSIPPSGSGLTRVNWREVPSPE